MASRLTIGDSYLLNLADVQAFLKARSSPNLRSRALSDNDQWRPHLTSCPWKDDSRFRIRFGRRGWP